MGSGSTDTGEGSRIQITRRTTYWWDLLRAYRIYIDGQYVGKIRNGEAAEFLVAPGLHEVFLRIDWCGSPRLSVKCAPGGEARLTCRAHLNPFGAYFAIFFAPNEYIRWLTVPDPS